MEKEPVKLISFIRKDTYGGNQLHIGFLIEDDKESDVYWVSSSIFEDGSSYEWKRFPKQDCKNVCIEEAGYWDGK